MLPWVLWVHSLHSRCDCLVPLRLHVHVFNVESLLPWSQALRQACHMSARPASVFPAVQSHTDVPTGDGETFWQEWA